MKLLPTCFKVMLLRLACPLLTASHLALVSDLKSLRKGTKLSRPVRSSCPRAEGAQLTSSQMSTLSCILWMSARLGAVEHLKQKQTNIIIAQGGLGLA